jgi:hypothetical protein
MKFPRRNASVLGAAVISAAAGWLVPGTAHAATAFHLKEAEQLKCLDIRTEDGATTEGARLQRFSCANTSNQFWEPIELASGTFLLRNPRSQKCVTVDTPDFNAQVVQRTCDSTNRGQLWTPDFFFTQGSGFVTLRPALAPGSCLDTLGQFVKIFPCATQQNNAQLWELV